VQENMAHLQIDRSGSSESAYAAAYGTAMREA